MLNRKEIGAWGEERAARYLRRKHYRIVERNFACKLGEIDLIVKNREYLVFVEVKQRKNADHGMPREFVTAAKQARLRQTAMLWLEKHPTPLQPRFDVVEVYAPEGTATKKPEITHLENAFS